MQINGQTIGHDGHCFTIAEAGSNHAGELATALDLIRAAKEAGADAVKMQRRSNRTLYTRAAYNAPYVNENSYGPTYGEHREALELTLHQWRVCADYAKDIGITLFGTAFDERSVDDLHGLELPAIKVASGDLTNTPLIRYAASTGLPLIISTGGGTEGDVFRALEAAADAPGIGLLQCTMAYPCAYENLNLSVIRHLSVLLHAQGWDGVEVGASLHDNGIAMAVAAYMLGARIIEKHLTLNRASKGTDHAFSLEPQGFRKLVRDLERTRVALGDGVKQMLPCEIGAWQKMAKSLYTTASLSAGTVLTGFHLKACSPAHPDGVAPYMLDELIGRTLTEDVGYEQPICWSHVAAHDPALSA